MCDRMHACMCACGACQNETDHFKNLQTRFTPCCGLLRMYNLTVSNCIIKQHNLRQCIVTVAAVRLKPTILENLIGPTHVLFDKKSRNIEVSHVNWTVTHNY